MKLSFLIQLILLIFFIVVIYLLFTNSIQGKMKLVLIVFCLFTGAYLFTKMSIFKNYSEILEEPRSAKLSATKNVEDLKATEGPIGFSTWFYIDDWNYRYGERKYIVLPEKTVHYFPEISLDAYKNNLEVKVSIISEDTDTAREDLYNILVDNSYYLEDADFTFGDGTVEYSDVSQINFDCSNNYINISGEYDDGDVSAETTIKCSNSGPETVVIENINIQKWVNIIVTFNNRTLDVYINGKLLKSTPFDNVIQSRGDDDSGSIQMTPSGGFGGYIGKTDYYPYFVNPSKAWSIYKGGFGDAFESTLNKYNMTVAFYEDNVEKNKFHVF